MASGPITSQKIDGEKMETMTDFIFLGSKITVDGDCSHEIKRHLLLGRKAITNLECIKKQRHYLANKGPSSQSYGFSSSYVWMWELDHKEGLALKNWCFWTVVLPSMGSHRVGHDWSDLAAAAGTDYILPISEWSNATCWLIPWTTSESPKGVVLPRPSATGTVIRAQPVLIRAR